MNGPLASDHQDGQGLIEYALILALISIVVIGVLMLFGDPLIEVFNRVLRALQFALQDSGGGGE